MKHTFEADGILLEFGTTKILSSIYLKCETGLVTGIVGRNGQGKTCLMNVIYGNLKPHSRSVRFDNTFIPNAFKRPDLLTYLPQFNFVPSRFSTKRVFKDFDINLDQFLAHFPEFRNLTNLSLNNLSGGQRRLVEVYSIIKSKSKFSMLDEPFTHISPIQIEKIIEIISEEKTTKGFLITDHMVNNMILVCDKMYLLLGGKTHAVNEVEDLDRLGYIRL